MKSFQVHEVTVHRAGFWGQFQAPRVLRVWAQADSVMDVVYAVFELEQRAGRLPASFEVSACQRHELSAATLAALPVEELSQIVNYPFVALQAQWEKCNATDEQRRQRPVYIQL